MAEVTHLQIASIWIDVSIREEHNSQAELSRHPVEDGADVTDHVRLLPDQIRIEGVVTNQPIELPASHADGATADESGFALRHDRALPTGTTSKTLEGEPTLGFLGLLPGVAQATTLLRTVGPDVRTKKKLEMVLPQLQKSTAQFQANALRFSKEFDRVKAVHDALRAAFVARKPVQIVTGLRVYEAVVLIDLSIMRDAASAGTLHFGATGEIIRVVKSATGLIGAPDPVHARAKPAVSKGNQTTAPVPPAEIPPAAADRVSALEQGLRKFAGGL
jgi:hypothetical protein